MSAKAQQFLEMIQADKVKYDEVVKTAEEYFKVVGTERGSGYKLFKRWEWLAGRQLDAQGYVISSTTVWNEIEAFKQDWESRKATFKSAPKAAAWEELGPTYWSMTDGWNPGVGRIVAIAVEPASKQLMYVGSPGGGIWKSTDGGNNWTPLGDDMTNLEIWSISIDPNNTNTVYMGNSAGKVLKSTDAGANWNATGSGPSGTIRRILISKNTSGLVFASSSSGIWRSTNGGTSWTKVSSSRVEDMEFKPGDESVVHACGNDYFRSTNGGTSFSQISSGITTSERMKMAVSAAQPDYVYLLQKSGSSYGRLYRSTNGGTSFTVRNSSSTNYLGYSQDGSESGGQASRDMAICVSPSNAEEVHIAGIQLWKSTNGGTSFTIETYWSMPNNIGYCHADVEVLSYVGNTIYTGSDGGIYKSTNQGGDFTDLTVGVGIRQFYRIGGSKTDAYIVAGGAQDNGTSTMTSKGQWIDWLGADGMEAMIDHTNPNIQYGTVYNGSLYKTTNGGQTGNSVSTPDDGNWVTPFLMDPVDPKIIYGAFTNLYKHTNGGSGGSWTNITSSITVGGNIDAAAIAASNRDYIYISRDGNMWVTKNATAGSPSWTSISSGFSGNVNYIAVDPNDPDHVVIANTGSSVYESKNAGSSWTNISSGLPGVAAQCIVMDDNAENGIYVGMAPGIYYRDDQLGSWIPYMDGLPNVEVSELEIHYGIDKIRAATYGRGLWESDTYAMGPPSTDFTADATTSCDGTVQFTDASLPTPDSWVWDFGDGSTSSQQNPLHTYSSSGTYTVALTATNTNGSDTETKTQYITIEILTPPTTTGGQSCNPGVVNLSASGSGTGNLNWYDAATGGNLVNTGSTYAPNLSATTTFYVAEETIGALQKVGPADNTFGGGGYYTSGNTHGLYFDVVLPITLRTVKVFANSAANRTVEVRDNLNNVVASAVINIPAGESRITLDFNLDPGTDYFIKIADDGSTVDLYRNSDSPAYPYQINGLVSINYSSAGTAPTDYYYYFYDWDVQEQGCASARTPVVGEITCTGIPSTDGDRSVTVYPNPTSDRLHVKFDNVGSRLVWIKVLNVLGEEIYATQTSTVRGDFTYDMSHMPAGNYVVQVQNGVKESTFNIVVNH